MLVLLFAFVVVALIVAWWFTSLISPRPGSWDNVVLRGDRLTGKASADHAEDGGSTPPRRSNSL